MATLTEIDTKLAATAPGIHAATEMVREIAWMWIDYYLDQRLALTRPPVAP